MYERKWFSERAKGGRWREVKQVQTCCHFLSKEIGDVCMDVGGGGNVKCSQCGVKPSSADCCLALTTRCPFEVITLSPGQANQ